MSAHCPSEGFAGCHSITPLHGTFWRPPSPTSLKRKYADAWLIVSSRCFAASQPSSCRLLDRCKSLLQHRYDVDSATMSDSILLHPGSKTRRSLRGRLVSVPMPLCGLRRL